MGVINADYTGKVKVIMVNLGEQDYEVFQGDKLAQLIVEKILNAEAMQMKNLEATIRETKGFGSSDWQMTKQVGTSSDWLTKPLSEERKVSLSKFRSKKPSQDMPRPHMITKQSWEVTGPKDHNSPQNCRINICEITQKEVRQDYRDGEITGVPKFSQ